MATEIGSASLKKHENKVRQEDAIEASMQEIQRRRPVHLLQWMEISVTEPEKRTLATLRMQDTFVAYMVETRVTDRNMHGYGEGVTLTWRRYSDFDLLRSYLDATYPAIIVPPMPEKRASYTWQNISTDKFDPNYVERRRAALEIYTLRIAAHPKLCQDNIFLLFLKEELKNYCNDLQRNISSILKIRARLCDKLYGTYKVHANYARVFHEWGQIEKEMSQSLHSAGHCMDLYASSIDSLLEEEEQCADQLKEYYAFGDSLRSVCRRYECTKYNVERVEEVLSAKVVQRDLLAEGKSSSALSLSSVKSKLLGGETTEQHEARMTALNDQIAQLEIELSRASDEAEQFVNTAHRDIDRFKRQKVKDLQEILTNFAAIQVKRNKKAMAIWTSARDCFLKM